MCRSLAVVCAVCLVLGACASADQRPLDAGPDAEVPPDACVELPELCDGADQDCDGNVDEDFTDLGAACTTGVGECVATGVRVCNGAGTATVCDATSGTSEGELCNDLDDDCDGTADEGLGVGDDCDGADTDACLEGHIVCANDEPICDDTTGSTTETCNGVDDDCMNGADDPWPTVGDTCMTGTGACLDTGMVVCTSPTTAACDAVAGSPTAETCGDGIDQDCSGADVTCPTNDTHTGAIDISAGGTFTVDLSTAHDDTYTSGTFCGSTGGRDVYYQFTLPAAELVYLDTFGSNFDTVERIHAGACASTLGALQGCADDGIDACAVTSPVRPEQAAWNLAAGTYCLVVDQFSSSTTAGSLTLKMIRGGRTGTALPASPVNGTTAGGTSGNASTSCQPNASGNDVAYYFLTCPSVTRTVAASLCTSTTFDSILALRNGAATSADLKCADDNGPTCTGTAASFTGGSISGPGLGWLIVDGWNGASGTYTLTYSM